MGGPGSGRKRGGVSKRKSVAGTAAKKSGKQSFDSMQMARKLGVANSAPHSLKVGKIVSTTKGKYQKVGPNEFIKIK